MDRHELRKQAHDTDVTVWVGKHGIDAIAEEVREQLRSRELVKVKFLRASRSQTDTDTLGSDLAERVGATVIETRGNTVVLH